MNRTILLLGLYFGILQSALYFSILVYITATYFGYFIMMISWMGGTIFFMNKKSAMSYLKAVTISYFVYCVYLFSSWKFGSGEFFFPALIFIPILIFLIALSSGVFFKTIAEISDSTSIFLHENNGFILGMLLELLCFVKWGIYAFYYLPLIAFGLIIINHYSNFYITFGFYAITTFLISDIIPNEILSVMILLGFYLLGISYSKPKNMVQTAKDSFSSISPFSSKLILLLSGFNLIILQNYITREFSNILSANEFTILIVAIAYFIGFSIGYIFNRVINIRIIRLIFPIIFIFHMLISLFVQEIMISLIRNGYGYFTLIGTLFFISLFTSSVYSIFLPKFIDNEIKIPLPNAYSWDLVGAIIGVISSIVLVWHFPQMILPVYFLTMILIFYVLTSKINFWWIYSLFALVIFLVFVRIYPEIKKDSVERYYDARGYNHSELIFSKNSFYHSVDVVDTHNDRNRKTPNDRISFINGVRFFTYEYDNENKLSGETSLSEFTYYLAELPAKYMHDHLGRKLRILILGGGSMYSIQRVSKYSKKTTLVEIDPVIVESSKQCWSELNRWDVLDNYEIIIDDAKHYLKKSDEKFDLIIMDISAPYYLGTALLHNRDFYKIVKDKLMDEGIFAESTQGRPKSNATESVPLKILRGVSDVFNEWVVIDCRLDPRGSRGFVFGSTTQQISSNRILEIMHSDNMRKGVFIYNPEDDRFNLDDTEPYSLTNMENLLKLNKYQMKSRLRIND